MKTTRRVGLFVVLGLFTVGEIRAESHAALERLKKDLVYLASDECEGRGPGTDGINKAADHIVAEFKKAGLRGGLPDGGFFQPFTIRDRARPGQPTAVVLKSPNEVAETLKLDSTFAPLGLSGTGKADAEVVFAGYGIDSEKANYNDYANLDVEGKIVLVIRRTPRYGNKDKPFTDDEDAARAAASLSAKIETAEKQKAAGIILVNDRGTAKDENDALSPFATFSFGSPAKIPAVHIKREQADFMLKAGFGKSLEDIETAIDLDLKPVTGPVKGWTAEVEVTIDRNRQIPVKNVVAVLDGAGPLADETLVIGAHYDHLGYGGRDSLDRSNTKNIHHGADDNASGTTSILELARRFAAIKDRQGRRLVFIAFSAEERGLLGSSHYCKEPLFPLDKTYAMINLDMVGRLVDDPSSKLGKLDIGGIGTAKSFDGMIDRHNAKFNFKLKKTPAGMGPSDHQSFYLKNLPVLFFFTGTHPDYHRPSDTSEKVNLDGMSRIVDMVEVIAQELSTSPDKLEFVKTAGRFSPGSPGTPGKGGPRLGVMPDYDDAVEGMRLQGVMPGGPAEKAGFKEGDRIVEIAGKPVKNVTGYMSVMEQQKKGQPIEIIIMRDGKKTALKVTPE